MCIREHHAFIGKKINAWCIDISSGITNGVKTLIIGDNQDYVGLLAVNTEGQ